MNKTVNINLVRVLIFNSLIIFLRVLPGISRVYNIMHLILVKYAVKVLGILTCKMLK